jgi:hypothetical protein
MSDIDTPDAGRSKGLRVAAIALMGSGTALIVAVVVVILFCCIGPIVLCAFGAFGTVVDGTVPKAQVTLTSCVIDDDGFFTGATIGYQIKSVRSSPVDATVRFVVKDASGAQVGTGDDRVEALAGGATANRTAHVALDAKGGKTCGVVSVT